MRPTVLAGLGVASCVMGCGLGGTSSGGDDDGAGAGDASSSSGSGPSGSGGSGSGGGMPGVPELGMTFTVIGHASDGLNLPRDVAFHPGRGEAWTVNAPIDGTVIYFEPGTAEQDSELRIDYYAAHFMDEVSSIAMGANNTFATCQESHNTWNGEQPGDDYMGPTLWTADLAIYGKANQGNNALLGSHIDMLHESALCMGIAHDTANVYWVFDGLHGNVARYDFAQPHGVGEDDHSDGKIRVYVDAALTRVPGVPGHVELDRATGWLYVADTGGGRVIRLDTASGQIGDDLTPQANEPLDEYREMVGATVEVFAQMTQPSGIAIVGPRVFVGDHATGEVVAYDLASGGELGRMQTPAEGLMGLEVASGHLYYVDGAKDELVRVDP